MAAGLWIWGEEWGRSGSESSRNSAALRHCSGVPSQEMKYPVYIINDDGYVLLKSEGYAQTSENFFIKIIDVVKELPTKDKVKELLTRTKLVHGLDKVRSNLPDCACPNRDYQI